MRSITGEIPKYAMMIMVFLLLIAVLTVYFNYKYANIEAPSNAKNTRTNQPANASIEPISLINESVQADTNQSQINESVQADTNQSQNSTNTTG